MEDEGLYYYITTAMAFHGSSPNQIVVQKPSNVDSEPNPISRAIYGTSFSVGGTADYDEDDIRFAIELDIELFGCVQSSTINFYNLIENGI